MTPGSVNSAAMSIAAALRGPVRALVRRAADFVYPPACMGCGGPAAGHGGLCGDCWAGVRFIERPVCDVLGTPFADGAAGDAHADGALLSAEAIADPPPFARARSAVAYDGVARRLVHRLKYNDRTDLAGAMARWMTRAGADLVEDADAVVPVPLHRRRLVRRQFNQSAELARVIARRGGLPHLPATLARTRATRRQTELPAAARAENVRGAFRVREQRQAGIAGRTVLLVDDVYTTGATVRSAAQALLKGGAGKVLVLTFARALLD